MRAVWTFLICLLAIGCGKTYQPVAGGTGQQSSAASYEGQRISISGVPEVPKRQDFLAPTPLYDGHWTIVVGDFHCIETVNFENEPRIRAILQIADTARQQGQPVKVSGVIKHGQLEMEYFEDIRTDTPWYKNGRPYYSYAKYYEWYPFAYTPNSRTLKAMAR